MISLSLPTQRKKKTAPAIVGGTTFYPTTYNQHRQLGQAEYLRRDKLIQKLAKECPYGFGDMVRPNKDAEYAKYGAYRIVAVHNGWYAFKGSAHKNDLDVQWDENPRIVQAMNLFSGHTVEATTNFFRKVNDEEKQNAEKASSC